MNSLPADILTRWYESGLVYIPGILGALVVLVIGWIAGRILGKTVRRILDTISEQSLIKRAADLASVQGTVKNAGISVGYTGEIFTRIVIYLIAILAAVDILNMDFVSELMASVLVYIPHVAAFIIILVAGLILVNYFLDFLNRYYTHREIQFISPVLFILRVFLYFVIALLALSQLQIDLTVIYTFVTPLAWGIGLGSGAAVAIIVGFGLKNRSGILIDNFIEDSRKKS